MPLQVADDVSVDPTWSRLEEQIAWYDQTSIAAQRSYRRLKVTQIVFAAVIPFLAGFQDDIAVLLPVDLRLLPPLVIAALGVAIVVLEGLLHLNQYHDNWLTHRNTCEALKHEKFLFLASAGPYTDVEDKLLKLAERIEGLISYEHAKWVSERDRTYATRRAA